MVGHFWHQYLQEILVRHELADVSAIERRGRRGWGLAQTNDHIDEYEPFHWTTGSGDIAPCEVPGEGPYLVDFKTMKSMDFRRQDAPVWAVDKWESQVNIYMDFFDLERALIIGINKDSPHDMREFEFHRNQPLIDAIYDKWKLVSLCIDEGVAPPIDEEYLLPLTGPLT